MLDVFKQDAFSVVTLTDAINKAPHKPGRIGSLGLFAARGIRSTTIVLEEKDGVIQLIQTTPRGGPGNVQETKKRKARSFLVPHLELNDKVLADEVQGVRAFGSEDATQAVQTVIDEKLATAKSSHEVTIEHMRAGAIQGNVLDADESVLFNLFTEFGVSQQSHEIDLTGDVRNECVAIQRLSEAELGAEPVTGYRALCGDDFFDEFIQADAVKESLKYQESALLRTDLRSGFEYGGIIWENYRGKVGDVSFFPADEAFVAPIGPAIFKTYFAPADFLETVNTIGLPYYAKIAEGEMNRHAKLHTQSNPLVICTRPRAVIRITLNT